MATTDSLKSFGLPTLKGLITGYKKNKNNKREFKIVLKELSESNYKNAKLKPIEEDFAISLICRNYGAHQLRNTPSIYENFKDIIQRILNSIFYSVEKLYS